MPTVVLSDGPKQSDGIIYELFLTICWDQLISVKRFFRSQCAFIRMGHSEQRYVSFLGFFDSLQAVNGHFFACGTLNNQRVFIFPHREAADRVCFPSPLHVCSPPACVCVLYENIK